MVTRKITNPLTFFLILFFLFNNFLQAQEQYEPEFIGEVLIIKLNDEIELLSKEFPEYSSGISFSANSFNAHSLNLKGKNSVTKLANHNPLKLVVRALDNNSDPLSIITIYNFKTKGNKRTILLSENNEGTLLKSKNHTKGLLNYKAKKYGQNSYLIELDNLQKGEYGIIVTNPNNRDEKKNIVSTFSIQ